MSQQLLDYKLTAVQNMENQTSPQNSSVWKWLLQPLDKLKRRVAVVPSVNETVNAMKDIGVDLTNDETKD